MDLESVQLQRLRLPEGQLATARSTLPSAGRVDQRPVALDVADVLDAVELQAADRGHQDNDLDKVSSRNHGHGILRQHNGHHEDKVDDSSSKRWQVVKITF